MGIDSSGLRGWRVHRHRCMRSHLPRHWKWTSSRRGACGAEATLVAGRRSGSNKLHRCFPGCVTAVGSAHHRNQMGVLTWRRATGCSSATSGWRPPPTAPSMSSLRSPKRCTHAHPTGPRPTSTAPSPPRGRHSTTARGRTRRRRNGPTPSPRSRRRCRSARAQIADVVTNENGAPAQQSLGVQVFAATMVLDIYADIARSYPWSDERVGAMGQKVVVRRAPVGVCRGHHPVERAAVHHGDEARAVPRVGLDDGAQAGARDAARPVPARRCRARGRPSARRGEHRRRVARGERAPRHATPASTRSASPARPRPARASASCAAQQIKRVTLELGGKSAAIVLDDVDLEAQLQNIMHVGADEQRPGLRRPDPHPGAALALPELVDALAAARRRDAGRRPATIRPPPSARSSPNASATRSSGLHRVGQAAGRQGRRRRRPPGGPRQGLVRRADGLRRRRQLDAIAREEIFGPVLSVIPYDDRRRRRPHRQRLRLRPLRLGVDGRRRARGRGRRPVAHRHRPDQLGDAPRLQEPVRRLQEVGHRPRVGPEGIAPYIEYQSIIYPS